MTTYFSGTATYPSTIDPGITNLFTRYWAVDSGVTLPVIVLGHNYDQDSLSVTDATMQRFADYGFFVLVPGMRGRNSASGTRDSDGRELYDLRDAVTYARATWPTRTHQSKASFFGWSGGGGNALACACKFPDFFTVYGDMFGPLDLGYDPTNGWWWTNPAFQAQLAADLGDRLAGALTYRARNVHESLATILKYGGYAYLWHDSSDVKVDLRQSQIMRNVLARAGLTAANFVYSESTAGSPYRWLHNTPDNNPDNIQAELQFKDAALGNAVWQIPTSGSMRVIGYQKNSRFEIWLQQSSSGSTPRTNGGLDGVADVTYDTTTNTYAVTPRNGPLYVEIDDGTIHTTTLVQPTYQMADVGLWLHNG